MNARSSLNNAFQHIYIYIQISKIPGSTQANKLIAGLPEKRKRKKTQGQFRHDLLEPQKRVNYQHEFDQLHGAKTIIRITTECDISYEGTSTKSSTITQHMNPYYL